MSVSVGALRHRVTLCTAQSLDGPLREWVPLRTVWAGAEGKDKRTIFSTIGLSARTVEFTLRRQGLQEGDMIVWNERWHYVVATSEVDRNLLRATTAAVTPVKCSAVRVENIMGPGNRPVRTERSMEDFSGVLTQRYAGVTQEGRRREYAQEFALITPKGVCLALGDLVSWLEGITKKTTANVTEIYLLDEVKNEYSLVLEGDL